MNFAMAVQGTRPLQLEPTDPLYIHPSDQPGQPLVSTPFNGENFDNWRRSVIIALSAKHKVALIDGSCECPAATAPTYIFWQRNNAMVLSWLLNSLNDNIRNSVLYFETARELWLDLEGRFGQSNKARLFQVQKDVSCLAQGDLDIAGYYTKAKQLWDESNAVSTIPRCTCKKCECNINEKQQVYIEEKRLIQFLMGLNGSYTAIRGNILMMVPFPSISQAYSLLVQEERQRQVKTETHFLTESASLSVGLNKTFPASDSSKTTQKRPDLGRRSHLTCEHCKKTGHTIDKCYKLHGYPNRPTNRGRGGYGFAPGKRAYSTWTETADQATMPETHTPAVPGLNAEQSKQLFQFITNLTNGGAQKANEQDSTGAHLAGIVTSGSSFWHSQFISCLCKLENGTWILDSGASDHMSYDPAALDDLQAFKQPLSVTLPNGYKVLVHQYGKLHLSDDVTLDHVLLVPHFKYNLLSIKALTSHLHCEVVFTETLCILQGPSLRRPVAVGRETHGLYLLDREWVKQVELNTRYVGDSSMPFSSSLCNQVSKGLDAVLWHRRVGHMPYQRMKLLGINFTDVLPESSPCDICPRARQQRLAFPSSITSTTSPFELVHVDTWGPYHTKTHAGHRFFLTIVDDFTRTTWTHLMTTKDEAMGLITAFVHMAKTQFNAIIKVLRSDNALELSISQTALHFFHSHGIIHQTSCVQTPQQNGIVERKHKHLLEVSRALLFQSHLPLRYWGECVLTATYLINRFPSTVLQNKTPFEMLHGQKPSYEHLRVFGCLCYMTTCKQGRDKFQPRAIPCVFLGYPHGKKAYKVMALDTHKFHLSRDVIFHEDIFPFSQNKPDHSMFPSPPALHNDLTFSTPALTPEPSTPPADPAAEHTETPTVPTATEITPPPVRRSTRGHKTPSYLNDYLCTAHAESHCMATLTNLDFQPLS